ncbi:hypothetical protein PINS_up006031 [Pythium insidiosum]|nr:hypothetical protein PINS_up006031 [Pythium insidiosum]
MDSHYPPAVDHLLVVRRRMQHAAKELWVLLSCMQTPRIDRHTLDHANASEAAQPPVSQSVTQRDLGARPCRVSLGGATHAVTATADLSARRRVDWPVVTDDATRLDSSSLGCLLAGKLDGERFVSILHQMEDSSSGHRSAL